MPTLRRLTIYAIEKIASDIVSVLNAASGLIPVVLAQFNSNNVQQLVTAAANNSQANIHVTLGTNTVDPATASAQCAIVTAAVNAQVSPSGLAQAQADIINAQVPVIVNAALSGGTATVTFTS